MASVDTKPNSTPHLWRSAFLMSSVFSIIPEIRKTVRGGVCLRGLLQGSAVTWRPQVGVFSRFSAAAGDEDGW